MEINHDNYGCIEMATLQFFPEEFILLSQELQYHPDLVEILGTVAANEPEMKLAHIASYCEIILDGIYDEASLTKLAGICLKILKNKRTIQLVSSIDAKGLQ